MTIAKKLPSVLFVNSNDVTRPNSISIERALRNIHYLLLSAEFDADDTCIPDRLISAFDDIEEMLKRIE